MTPERLPFAPCRMNVKDCAAQHRSGGCTALSDTRFEGGRCPFYKSREAKKAEELRLKPRLEKLGYVVSKPPAPCGGAVTSYDERHALYEAGMTDKEIAEALGLKSETIRSWRKRWRYPANIMKT